MKLNFDSNVPIYLQIADEIEEAIFIGAFKEETQIPSTTELSTTFNINPATVLKGMNLLVDRGIVYKKRGVGVFVINGAIELIKVKRQDEFFKNYIESLVAEAQKLNLSKEDIMSMIERSFENEVRS